MRRSLFALALLWLAGPARAADPPVYADPPAAAVKAAGCDCDGCACPPGTCPDCKAGADPRRATVYVSQSLGGGAFACGTGTVVAAGGGKSLVLTNAHVVESGDGPIYVIDLAAGRPRTSEALYWHGSAVSPTGPGTIHVHGPDLCLLAVGVELPAVEVAADLPAVGAAVRQYGFGGRRPGQPPTEKHGQVVPPRTSSPCLNTTIPSQSGDSGAGIFDARGRLVGVCWGGGECQYAVRLDEVHTFTVRALTDTRGPFARFRDRLAARAIARELIRPSTPAAPSCPGGACRPGVQYPAFGGCPGGVCPRR